jgi:hypothetical protein
MLYDATDVDWQNFVLALYFREQSERRRRELQRHGSTR